MDEIIDISETIQAASDKLHPVVGEACEGAFEGLAKDVKGEEFYAMLLTFSGDPETREKNAGWVVSAEEQFKAAALDAVKAGDYNFFERMARAVKTEKQRPVWQRANDGADQDPVWNCFFALGNFVFTEKELPTVDELKSLAKLTDEQWKRTRKILKLAGKLPRKAKDGGI